MKKFISWVEIPTQDFQRAVKFYNHVLNTKLEIVEDDLEKMACFPGGEGAIIFADGFKPSKQGVVVSLNAGTQLDETIHRISATGGKILKQKTKIEAEGMGYFALFEDSEGNRLGLYGEK